MKKIIIIILLVTCIVSISSKGYAYTDVTFDGQNAAGGNTGYKWQGGDWNLNVPNNVAINVDTVDTTVSANPNGRSADITFARSSNVSGTLGTGIGAGSMNLVHLDGNGTVTVGNTVYTQTLSFSDNRAVLSIVANADINATDITAAANGNGTIIFQGSSNVNVTNSLGTNANRLNQIDVDGGVGSTVVISNDAYVQNININDVGTLDLNGSFTGDILNYADDGTVTIADTKNITATVTTSTAGEGTLTLEGTNTVTGQISGGKQLKALNLNGAGGDIVTLSSDAFADTITVAGASTVDLNGSLEGITLNYAADATVEIADGEDITAAITTSVNSQGTLTLEGTNTVSGQIGADATRLKALNFNGAGGTTGTLDNDAFAVTTTVSGAGTLDLDGSLTGTTLAYTADGTVEIADGENITAAITTNAPNQGTLTLGGTSTITGQVGTNANRLKALNIGGGTATFTNDIYAATTTLSGAGTLDLDVNLTGTTLNYTANGTVEVANGVNLSLAVTTNANNQGILTLEGTSTVNGQIGAGAAELREINFNGAGGTTATFSNDAYATTTTVGGAGILDLNGSFIGTTLAYTADGTVTIADTKNITAVVTTNSGGTLTLEGTNTVSGKIGTNPNRLKALNFNGAGGATSTLSSDVFVDTTTVGGTGILDLNGNLTGTTLNYTADGTATIADTKDITVAVTTSANSQGTLTLEGTNTVSGQIGTNANRLKALNFNGAGGTTGTLNSDVFADTTTVGGVGTLALLGSLTGTVLNYTADGIVTVAALQTLNLPVTTSVNNQGTLTFLGTSSTAGTIGAAGNGLAALNINGGTLTLGHNVVATTTTVNNAATLLLNDNRDITGNLTLAGTSNLNIGLYTLTLGGTGVYTQGINTTLHVGVDGTNAGQVAGSGNAAVNATSTINISTSNYIPDTTAYTIVDGAGGAGVNVPATITDNSVFVTFTGSTTGSDLIVTASRTNSYDMIAQNSNAAAAGAALESAGFSGATGDMLAVLNTLESSSVSDIADSLNTLYPAVDNGIIDTSYSALKQSLAAITKRIRHLKRRIGGANDTGISTGDEAKKDIEIWGQGFGNYIRQSSRGGITGYDATILGVNLGADSANMIDKLTLGLCGGYANGDVQSKNNHNTSTRIHGSQITAYGTYDLTSLYIDLAFSFGLNRYIGERRINLVNTQRVADSDYYGQQYSVFSGIGYTFTPAGFEITPIASLQYMHLRLNSYTETGAGALNLEVSSQNYDLLESGIGMKLAYPLTFSSCTITPEVRAMWLYDFIGDKQQTTSSFVGGGISFDTYGVRPARSSYDFGGTLLLEIDSGLSIAGDYDYEVKDGYINHAGYVTVKYDF